MESRAAMPTISERTKCRNEHWAGIDALETRVRRGLNPADIDTKRSRIED